MTYDTYVLVLCAIVYVMLTGLSIFVVCMFTKMSVRLIRRGAEDKKMLKELVRRNMQNAIGLSVPLIVDDSFGKNWYEVK